MDNYKRATYKELWRENTARSCVALAEQKYGDVIKLSTEGLNKLIEDQVFQLLHFRSIAYEKQGLLSRALEDALRMVQYVPTSASGYLRVGSIHFTNGKPDQAIDYYKRGFEVIPKSHPQYCQLHEHLNKAVLQTQLRFDIIGKLPLELLCKILLHLDSHSLWVCITVSRWWCDRVSRCGSWWDFVIVEETGTEIDQVMCDAVPLVQDRIQNLELTNSSSATLNEQYLIHLKNGVFTKLKGLSMREGCFQSLEAEDLAVVFWQLRGTLSTLKLDIGSDDTYSLLRVLTTCPNIENLSFTTAGHITYTAGSKSKYSFQSIGKRVSNLELCYGSTTFDALCSYLELCPNLCRLVLQSSSSQRLGGTVYKAFTDYCPKLRILGLNCVEGLPVIDGYDCSADTKGVIHMSVAVDNHFDLHHLADHLNAQSYSLQRLTIRHKEYSRIYYSSYTTPRIFNKLNTLQYTFDRSGNILNFNQNSNISRIQAFIGNLIRNSPLLSDLSLIGGPYLSTHIRTPLEQAVQTKLRVLTFTSVSFENTDSNWYKSLFSSLGHVHTATFHDVDMSEEKLYSLAVSEYIQQLTLIECKGITNEVLAEFFKRIALRPFHRLNTLNITGIPISMDNSSVWFLLKINSLKTFRITNCKHIIAEPINYLIACAPTSTLKVIEILDCFPPDVAASWSNSVNLLKKSKITLRVE